MLFLLAGCATTSQQLKDDHASILGSGLEPKIVEKVNAQKTLTGKEIIQMTRKGVDEAVIVRSIERSGARYNLDTQDVKTLTQSGVSDNVVDALLESERRERYRNNYFDPWLHHGYGWPYYRHGRYFGHRRHHSYYYNPYCY